MSVINSERAERCNFVGLISAMRSWAPRTVLVLDSMCVDSARGSWENASDGNWKVSPSVSRRSRDSQPGKADGRSSAGGSNRWSSRQAARGHCGRFFNGSAAGADQWSRHLVSATPWSTECGAISLQRRRKAIQMCHEILWSGQRTETPYFFKTIAVRVVVLQ